MAKGKRMKLLVPVVGFLFVTMALAQAPGLAADKVNFGTSFKGAPNYDLLGWAAEEKGFWKGQGLDVTWIAFRGAPDVYNAISAGSLDLGVGATIGTILSIAGGAPAVIVANFPAPAGFHIFVLRDSPIRNIRDLKGARISVSRFGGADHLYGQAAMKTLGMERDVRFVSTGFAVVQMAALKARAVDTMLAGEQSMAGLLVTGQIRTVADMSDYLPKKWTENVVGAGTAFIAKRPEALNRALKAIFQAVNFVRANRDWAAAKLQLNLGFDPEAARYISKQVYPEKETEKIDPEALGNVLKVLVDYGVVAKEKALPVGKLYTTKFLD